MDEKTIPLSKLPVDVKALLVAKKQWGGNLDYRALFEQTGECVFIIGLDFHFITANQQALNLLGYQEHRLMGMPVEEIMSLADPTDREAIVHQHASVSEHTLKKRDGSMLPVEMSISVVHNEEGQPIYVQMLARDITERKHAETNLKRQARALSIIGEVTASLFRATNIEERIPEVLESLGYAVGVFNCAIFDINDDSIKIKYQWADRRVAHFDIAFVAEPFIDSLKELPDRVFSVTDFETPDPLVPTISLLIIPVQGMLKSWGFLGLFDRENRLSWLPTIFDIVQTTANMIGAALERLHYEKNLRLSEARNRAILTALPDLLLRVDISGRILDYNASANHPLYLPQDSVIGKNLNDLWPDEIVKKIMEQDAQQFFTGSHWVEEFTLPGRSNIYEARLYPISEVEALIVARDVTEQARLSQMKSDFINRASHELRTPLTSAILMAELIQQGGTPEELDEYWRTLNGELNRQKNLINELLMAGRLESGTMRIEIVPMDVIPVLQDSITAVKPIAAKRRTVITLESEFDSLNIMGDKSGLQQVFINLINNAVKFSPEGKPVEVKAVKAEGDAFISIKDHGLGIPPDALPHLFERFYRASNVTIAEIPGSGIGLYIVKSIVDELGGEINVSSEINNGTTFTIKLCLA